MRFATSTARLLEPRKSNVEELLGTGDIGLLSTSTSDGPLASPPPMIEATANAKVGLNPDFSDCNGRVVVFFFFPFKDLRNPPRSNVKLGTG
jgi:hypothetical protein